MSHMVSFERCLSYIDCQMQQARGTVRMPRQMHAPAVTISRQTGAGSIEAAEVLLETLNARRPRGTVPWTVFHKNLLHRVLEDHHLPGRLAEFMPEDRVSAIKDAMEELLGLHPPAEDLVQQTTETILKLAEMGHVILVGRGANVITAQMKHVVRVRLVGSLERRVPRVQEFYQMDRRAALAFIQTEDAARARYLKKYFGKQIDDPLLYDLMLNTDRLTNREAADMIAVAVVEPPPED